jgi:hypothetical protein
MRAFLVLIVAFAMAGGGLAAVSVVLPVAGSPALAAKAKAKASGKRTQRRSVPQTTGFEHQQCSVQNPCSTRNQW